MKPKAFLSFCMSEFYWEFGRFAPYIIYLKNTKYKDVNLIVLTRPENFDIYGKHASILVPFRLKNSDKFKADCFKLHGISEKEYLSIIEIFKTQYSTKYDILETVFPDISGRLFSKKSYYPEKKKVYDYQPRDANAILLNTYLDNRPLVIFGPRYRTGFKRNWPYWNKLYDLIWDDKNLTKKYNFIICGKNPDYISDKKDRFLDINNIKQNINTSLVGLTIESMKRAILTIGSQSAIPNISLLFKVPVIEWGHEKELHTKTYNPFNVKVDFIQDLNYNVEPEKIFLKIKQTLK